MALDLTRLHRRPELLALGYTDEQLQRHRRDGELATVRRGTYVAAPDLRLDDPATRHALLVAAAWPTFADGTVLSHCSAAVLLGLPVWSVPLGRVHVTRARPTGGRIGRVAHLHTAPLRPEDVIELDGRVVTSPARTVLDVTRTVSFEAGVVLADAALRAGLVDGEQLVDCLRQAARWRGIPTARQVVGFADGRSESVGESRSRVALYRAGLPASELQWEIRRDGVLLGRVDFGWPESRVVGEFDGRIKYGRLLEPGRDAGDAVFEEKRREDRLRAEGLRVVRWVWDDLSAFDATAARLRRALNQP